MTNHFWIQQEEVIVIRCCTAKALCCSVRPVSYVAERQVLMESVVDWSEERMRTVDIICYYYERPGMQTFIDLAMPSGTQLENIQRTFFENGVFLGSETPLLRQY